MIELGINLTDYGFDSTNVTADDIIDFFEENGNFTMFLNLTTDVEVDYLLDDIIVAEVRALLKQMGTNEPILPSNLTQMTVSELEQFFVE